jgi:hypothetical protein
MVDLLLYFHLSVQHLFLRFAAAEKCFLGFRYFSNKGLIILILRFWDAPNGVSFFAGNGVQSLVDVIIRKFSQFVVPSMFDHLVYKPLPVHIVLIAKLKVLLCTYLEDPFDSK